MRDLLEESRKVVTSNTAATRVENSETSEVFSYKQHSCPEAAML